MTPGEVSRYIDGATWRYKMKAQYDYVLADLIGVSNARLMSKEVEFPSIEECYPTLFKSEAEEKERAEEEQRMINSQNNFMAFALKFNARKQGVEDKQ